MEHLANKACITHHSRKGKTGEAKEFATLTDPLRRNRVWTELRPQSCLKDGAEVYFDEDSSFGILLPRNSVRSMRPLMNLKLYLLS